MKIYVLESSSGSYDDYRTNVEGCFSSLELASERKIQIEEENQSAKNISNPIGGIDDCFSEEFDKLPYMKQQEYFEWSNKKYEANEFNGCEIIEFELDK